VFFEGGEPEEFFLGCSRTGAYMFAKDTGMPQSHIELRNSAFAAISDPDASKLISWMDEAGIDRAVILPLDFGPGCDEPALKPLERMTIYEKNEVYAGFARKYEGRLFSYLGVDPRRRGALDFFKKGIQDWGMLGLKLHPTTGFYPSDPICYPFYEAATEMGVPVLIHSGTEPAPLKPMFSQPKYIDAAAGDFPDCKFIIAHCGHGWWMEALDMGLSKPNLYVDFSGWQAQYSGDPDYFYFALRAAINLLGPWRVMFGTDGSMTNFMVWPKAWLEAWLEPNSPSGIGFAQEEIDIVTGGAAARIYGWD
jgi:predicted TIM-barrel fold metal-dependent hydrolase